MRFQVKKDNSHLDFPAVILLHGGELLISFMSKRKHSTKPGHSARNQNHQVCDSSAE